MHYESGAGRSRRSPGTWAGTVRRFGPISTGTPAGRPACPRRAGLVRPVRRLLHGQTERGSALVGHRPVRRGRQTRARPLLPIVHPGVAAARSAPGVRAVPTGEGSARSRSSTTRPVRKRSGTGSSCPTHRPAGTATANGPTCWSGHWHIRLSGAAGCANRWTSRTGRSRNIRSR